jgi:c-di-GMP-binding flagellar brake protein YcgR
VANGQIQDDTLKFKDLGVGVGAVLTAQTLTSVRKLSIKLIGYTVNKSLLVTAPLRENKEVLLERGEVLMVRLLFRNRVCAFETKVIYRSRQPYTYYHLEYPQSLETLEVRSSERVDLTMKIEVDSEFDMGLGDWPLPAELTNLSKTGGAVISRKSLGDIGHEVVLKFTLDISGMQIPLDLSSVIRNKDVINDEKGKFFQHGVQFVGLSVEDKLTLASYVYETELNRG